MEKEEIRNRVQKMQTKTDLLVLINELKHQDTEGRGRLYTLKQLNYLSDPNHTFLRFREFDIPKKSGGMRHICAPFATNYKYLLRYVNTILQSVYEPSAHTMGFVQGKSIVDNAKAHIGMNYVFNMDLSDFFPSVAYWRIIARLEAAPYYFTQQVAVVIAGLCCMRIKNEDKSTPERKYLYVLPQGSPASPVLTNMICEKMDYQLAGLANRFGLLYTRYADDITFSSMHNVYQEGSDFRHELERIITEQGFIINPKKTRLNVVGFRQEVTGLTVTKEKVNVSRKYIKDLRGLLHIWERYGYLEANKRFRARTEHSYYERIQLKQGTNLSNVVEGKIAFLKMVKGGSDSTYLKLKERYEKQMNKCHRNQPLHTKFLYRETLSLAEFEQKYQTVIQYDPKSVKSVGLDGVVSASVATCAIKGNVYWIYVKKTANIVQPKENLRISFCENKDRTDAFWLIHEPYISQYFKTKSDKR